MAEPATNTAPRPKLLIVDDDPALCSMLVEYLGPEGFLTEAVGSGPAALERLGREAVDLVVLDVMLPELSGFEVLRRIRALNRVPVIMLTARGEEVDRVVGLEMGADDYLAKPFSPRELVARIRAVLRRMSSEGHSANGAMQWGPLRIDLRARRADVNDQDLELTAAELRILELLVRADTKTVTRDELMTQALGRRLLPTDRSLDTHVSNLRRKLAKATSRVSVQSVRGTGYALALASRPDDDNEPKMTPLYERICLSSWLALALILVGTVSVVVNGEQQRRFAQAYIMRSELYAQATEAFETAGPEGLRTWLTGIKRPEISSRTYVLDFTGKEMLGRAVPESLRDPTSEAPRFAN